MLKTICYKYSQDTKATKILGLSTNHLYYTQKRRQKTMNNNIKVYDTAIIDFERLPKIFPKCPKCESEMQIKTAKARTHFGKRFWSCSKFPACRSMLHLYELTALE